MTDIPDDIMEVARGLVANYGNDPDGLLVGAICAALEVAEKRGEQRERERAAMIGYRICAETRHMSLGEKVAAAIRNT